jgi:hypothetical protein
VLVDGRVAGIWRDDAQVEYLAPATRTQKAEVADEGKRLRAWLSAS